MHLPGPHPPRRYLTIPRSPWITGGQEPQNREAEHENADRHVQAAKKILASMAPGDASIVMGFLSALPRPTSVLSRGTGGHDMGTQTDAVESRINESTVQTRTDGEVWADNRANLEEPTGLHLHRLHPGDRMELPLDEIPEAKAEPKEQGQLAGQGLAGSAPK